MSYCTRSPLWPSLTRYTCILLHTFTLVALPHQVHMCPIAHVHPCGPPSPGTHVSYCTRSPLWPSLTRYTCILLHTFTPVALPHQVRMCPIAHIHPCGPPSPGTQVSYCTCSPLWPSLTRYTCILLHTFTPVAPVVCDVRLCSYWGSACICDSLSIDTLYSVGQ